jgi:hypothetical protein
MTSPTNPPFDPSAHQGPPQPPATQFPPATQASPTPPSSPYAAQGAPFPPSTAPVTAKNPLGTTALALGLGLIAILLVNAVAQRIAIMSGDFTVVGVVGAVIGVLTALVAIAAIIIGAIAVQRPGVPHGAAGVGLGIGIAELSATVIWFLVGLVPY